MTDNNHPITRDWRDYRSQLARDRAEASIKLAPRPEPRNLSPRAAAALRRARKRTAR